MVPDTKLEKNIFETKIESIENAIKKPFQTLMHDFYFYLFCFLLIFFAFLFFLCVFYLKWYRFCFNCGNKSCSAKCNYAKGNKEKNKVKQVLRHTDIERGEVENQDTDIEMTKRKISDKMTHSSPKLERIKKEIKPVKRNIKVSKINLTKRYRPVRKTSLNTERIKTQLIKDLTETEEIKDMKTIDETDLNEIEEIWEINRLVNDTQRSVNSNSERQTIRIPIKEFHG